MTREELKKEVLSYNSNHIVLQLPTGYGKSRIALEVLNTKYPKEADVLIVCPKLVLFKTWKDEINKWFPNNKWKLKFTSYVSFPKHSTSKWNIIIFDECHHITERIKANYYVSLYDNVLFLSATIKRETMQWLKWVHTDLAISKLTLKDAIDDDVLPEPKVFVIPLTLDNGKATLTYIRNKRAKTAIDVPYAQRGKYLRRKDVQVRIKCTPYEYNKMLENDIEFYKNLYMNNQNPYQKNIWLHLAGERLKFLSKQKEEYVKEILNKFSNYRVITFCADIKQTESLGKNVINSANKNSSETLSKFNNYKINHITCCNMLNEGVNLINCQIGVWAMLNSSSIMIVQKIGRLLRHPNPVIILPVFQNTRETEITDKMLENFSQNNIVITQSLNYILNEISV